MMMKSSPTTTTTTTTNSTTPKITTTSTSTTTRKTSSKTMYASSSSSSSSSSSTYYTPSSSIVVTSLLLLSSSGRTSSCVHSFQTPFSSSSGNHHRLHHRHHNGGGTGGGRSSSPSSSSTTHSSPSISSTGRRKQQYQRNNGSGISITGKKRGTTTTTTLTTTTTTIEEAPMIPMDTSLTNNPNIPTALSPAEEEEIWNLMEGSSIISSIGSTSSTTATTSTTRTQPSTATTIRLKPKLFSYSTWRNKPILRSIIPAKEMIPELIGESFGTFILLQLVLGIVPAAIFTSSLSGGVFPIAILTGMGIPIACSVVASKSAAHFNPAVTWAMCLYRGFGWNKLFPYITAQIFGATAAAGMNYILFEPYIKQFEVMNGLVRTSITGGGLQTAKAFACYFNDPITSLQAIISETWGTFILTSVVFALTSQRNTEVKGLFIPPLIGSVVTLLICVLGPISSASFNPAREIGPRLILKLFGWSSTVAFHQLPIYIVSALIGSTIGGLFIDHFLYRGPSVVELQELQHQQEPIVQQVPVEDDDDDELFHFDDPFSTALPL